jgi:uncharacterized membrane protein (DUF4010 family)
MDDFAALPSLLTSLGVGLMMGLERERRAGTNAGLRTFGLVGMAGTVCALLAAQTGDTWLVPAVALGLVGMMIAADYHRGDADGAPDTTTTVALLLCFLFGVMAWHGYLQLTVTLALGTTALLYFKAELHDVTHRLTRQDIVSFLQFALITFVVLPVLPDVGYGPYGQLNPYRIWLMVVLTSGLSLAGYAALRIAPGAKVVPVLGVLGGLVSSTATTLVFSRRVREDPRQEPVALAIILIANLVLLVRVGVLAALIAPGLLVDLVPILLLGLATGAAWSLRGWLKLGRAETSLPEIENPAELRHALAFGAIYAVVLVAIAAFHERAGAAGVYTVAAFSGLTDMDAVAISIYQFRVGGELAATEACRALVIALGANLLFKNLLVAGIAGRKAGLHIAGNYLAVYAGLLVGIAIQALRA